MLDHRSCCDIANMSGCTEDKYNRIQVSAMFIRNVEAQCYVKWRKLRFTFFCLFVFKHIVHKPFLSWVIIPSLSSHVCCLLQMVDLPNRDKM